MLRADAAPPGRGRLVGAAAVAATTIGNAAIREDRDGPEREPHPLRDRV